MTGATATGARRALKTFSVIPHDCCPRCPPEDMRLGMPVAVAGSLDGEAVLRYVCPACRLIWDTSWNLGAIAECWPCYGTFEDRFIRDSERLESHEQGGVLYPTGPRELLRRSAKP